MGESSTTLHLTVRPQWGVIVEPDLMVADVGSDAEFRCKVFPKEAAEGEFLALYKYNVMPSHGR